MPVKTISAAARSQTFWNAAAGSQTFWTFRPPATVDTAWYPTFWPFRFPATFRAAKFWTFLAFGLAAFNPTAPVRRPCVGVGPYT